MVARGCTAGKIKNSILCQRKPSEKGGFLFKKFEIIFGGTQKGHDVKRFACEKYEKIHGEINKLFINIKFKTPKMGFWGISALKSSGKKMRRVILFTYNP